MEKVNGSLNKCYLKFKVSNSYISVIEVTEDKVIS